ncbi:hypothetical protein DXG01_003178 [Tephrocybe rancida]|nr:hypothetical protein DXG01_003178 [Tephrocybe rancida]
MAKGRNQQQDSEWSFSCRTTPYNADSDSDDTNNEIENVGSRISEETRLLNELDLSSREESVQYKPNPFSIAKINAASRAAPPETINPTITSRKVKKFTPIGRSSKAAGKKQNGNIIDGLKKQSQKAVIISKPKRAASITSKSSATLAKKQSAPHSTKSKAFRPLLSSHAKTANPPTIAGNRSTLVKLKEAPPVLIVPASTHILALNDQPTPVELPAQEPSQIAHIPNIATDPSPHTDDDSNCYRLDGHAGYTEALDDHKFSEVAVEKGSPAIGEASITRGPASPHYGDSQFLPLIHYDYRPSPNHRSSQLATEADLYNNGLLHPSEVFQATRQRPISFSSPIHQDNTASGFGSLVAPSRAMAMSSPLRPADTTIITTPRVPWFVPQTLAPPFSYRPASRDFGEPHSLKQSSYFVSYPRVSSSDLFLVDVHQRYDQNSLEYAPPGHSPIKEDRTSPVRPFTPLHPPTGRQTAYRPSPLTAASLKRTRNERFYLQQFGYRLIRDYLSSHF